MGSIEIRIYKNKVPAEAETIRREVFVLEQGFSDEFDGFDSISTHLVMFYDDSPVATLRFYDEGDGSCHVGRVAVKKDRRGYGFGKIIMNEAFELARAEGFIRMTVGAQEDKAGFYISCGFEPDGERYFEQNYPHLPLSKKL